MEVVAGGIAAGLFGYNRKNFMFDREQYIKRAYFGQKMKIKKYELYREDIHDLTELTVSKMDVYIVINVIQLLFCMMLFTEGMPRAGKTPLWLHWLFAAHSGSAVLYLILSIWLGMHASIAAHSFGARMLTQFVRLPVPNTKQIHSAAAKATDYEAASISEMLRVPVVKQQLRHFNKTLAEPSPSSGGMPDTTAREDDFLPQVSVARAAETAMLPHIQLYRELQANWQGYDAYSRVCMSMGTNLLLSAVLDFCLCVFLAEIHSDAAAICCMAVIAFVASLIARLDLLVTRRILIVAGVLQMAGPLLTLACLKAQQFPHAWKAVANWTVPLIFVLNIVWIACIIFLARADDNSAVSLPSKFRGVLYLDVFGWLTPQEASDARAREATVAEQVPSTGFVAAASPSTASRDPLPVSASASLADLCVRMKGELELQLQKWESEGLASMICEDRYVLSEVSNIRKDFDAAAADLERDVPDSATQVAAATPSPKVWLKLEWNTSGRMMEYFYDPDSGETLWTQPTAPDTASDLQLLREQVQSFAEQNKALSSLLLEERQRSESEPIEIAAATEANLLPVTSDVPVRSEAGAAGEAAGDNSSGSTQHFFGNTAAAAATFHPHNVESQFGAAGELPPVSRRPPGQLPWVTFFQGSMALMGIWVLGTVWCVLRLYFHILVPIRPPPGVPVLSSWWASHELDLELIFSGRWPHSFFNPKGLACHAAFGDGRLLVAEAHAVHELSLLSGGHQSMYGFLDEAPAWKPALRSCLDEVPHFVASGIRSISLRCSGGAAGADKAAASCTIVLLDRLGQTLLACPSDSHSTVPNASSVLFGGPWQAVAATEPAGAQLGTFWAKASEAESLVQLGSQVQRASQLQEEGALVSWGEALVPLLEVNVSKAASPSEQLLALPDGTAVLALEPGGTLWLQALTFPASAEPPKQLRLPAAKGARWSGLCSPGGRELLLVGKTEGTGDLAIWRTHLPAM